MRKNNVGFTLIELIVTIVLLALLAGIGTYTITSIIKKSKEENYNLLIKNIESAASVYYQECRYNHENSDVIICDTYDGGYITSLGQLVSYGYLEGNEKFKDGEDKGKYTIVNPLNDENIGSCRIIVKYDDEFNITFENNSICPSKDDVDPVNIDDEKINPSSFGEIFDGTDVLIGEKEDLSDVSEGTNIDKEKEVSEKEEKESNSSSGNSADIGGTGNAGKIEIGGNDLTVEKDKITE